MDASTLSAENLAWRQTVLDRKKPRPVYVQPVTFFNPRDGSVVLKNYAGSEEGIIQSFVDRYSDRREFGRRALAALKDVWEQDQQRFSMVPI